MANCDHRLEDRRFFQVGPKPVPLECTFDSGSGTHYAIRRSYDQAYFCQRCFAKICLDCHDPNQPDVSDSEDGGDDNDRKPYQGKGKATDDEVLRKLFRR